jgi:hypothetical protein
VRDTATWQFADGTARDAAIEQIGDNSYGLYVWRTLRKKNWCQVCDSDLAPGIEALGYDFDARWCIPCAVETFEFVYWDTADRRAARDAEHHARLRRIAEFLD